MNTKTLEMQAISLDVWRTKYQLIDRNGMPVDKNVDDMYKRVAKALGKEEYLWALRHGATPAGRILSNLGAAAVKENTSTINCTLSGTIYDSMDDILSKAHEAGLTLKSGAGIGYEFSTLRPAGAFIAGLGAKTSGPLSFMDIFDTMCGTISSAGGRRGAQMATFDVCHPDVELFVKAKRENGRLRRFNLSVLVSDEFLNAVRQDGDWKLYFPLSPAEPAEEVIYRKWPIADGYIVDETGLVACKVYKTIKARRLWDLIMKSTYDYAEPGVLFIDRINETNPLKWCENLRATNPCGEQPLPEYGACLLGSINLTKFVDQPFTAPSFDFEKFRRVVWIFTEMLDTVVEMNGLPLQKQRDELFLKRRHGMGYYGLGSTLVMLGMRYGSPESLAFVEKVTRLLHVTGIERGIELAKEKGPAPILESAENRRKYAELMGGFGEEILKHGLRFTHHSSIAPTGTIALSVGNNTSNGIEPSFSHHYKRNIIKEGKKTKEQVDVFSFEALLYGKELPPDQFYNAESVTPKEHVDVQAAAQKWVDSSISKTINVPTDIPFEDFKDIYLYAHRKGLKGCTTFRFNPAAFSGVLVNEKDLKDTRYQFSFEDGSSVIVRGDDEIEYDGAMHVAANLFDAMKEGTYGKF